MNLLPTPSARDSKGRDLDSRQGGASLPEAMTLDTGDWGPFAAAIARWEQVMGPAPAPTVGKRLSPDFVAWMMGYESEWVDGIPHTARLRCLGNAVVPRQALAAFSELLNR